MLAPYRLVGFEPDRIPHIHEASHFLGNSSPDLSTKSVRHFKTPRSPFKSCLNFGTFVRFETEVRLDQSARSRGRTQLKTNSFFALKILDDLE